MSKATLCHEDFRLPPHAISKFLSPLRIGVDIRKNRFPRNPNLRRKHCLCCQRVYFRVKGTPSFSVQSKIALAIFSQLGDLSHFILDHFVAILKLESLPIDKIKIKRNKSKNKGQWVKKKLKVKVNKNKIDINKNTYQSLLLVSSLLLELVLLSS